jgi:hypothetical protein
MGLDSGHCVTFIHPRNSKNRFMLKIILFISLATLIYSCGNPGMQNVSASPPNNTDLIQMNLKGRVQTMNQSGYTADSIGNTEKPDSISTEYSFDEHGYVDKQTSKDQAGATIEEVTFSRNDKGALTELSNRKKGKLASRLVTEISEDGLMYTGGKTFDSTGKQDSYYTDLKTNEFGIVYAGKQHKMDSTIKNEWDMKFDKTNFVGGVSKDSAGNESYRGSVVLNDKGDPASEVSTTREKDSTKTENLTYTYDGFDDKGNWTQRIAMKDGKKSKVLKRTFVYFKD